jgi:hypothetical protein
MRDSVVIVENLEINAVVPRTERAMRKKGAAE